MRRVAILGLAVATLTLVIVPVAGASGGQPIFREMSDERFVEDPELFVLEQCGVEVVTEIHIRSTFTLRSDLSATTQFVSHFVPRDPETGTVLLVERDAGMVFSQPEVQIVDEEAGTLTIMFENTVKGNPFKFLVPGEGVVILDAGQVTLSGTVVIDLATDEVLSFEQEISNVKGPHPFLESSDEEQLAIFCAGFGG